MLNRHLPNEHMLKFRQLTATRACGTSLIEVLVTLVILAFGLLGVAGLQMKIGTAEMESYQRAQALLVLSHMVERMSDNTANAAAYVTNGTVGTGDNQPANCNGIAPAANYDLCEWSNALKGAAEQAAVTNANVGAMVGARGCITQLQAENPTLGVCTTGIYQVAVIWQGMTPTAVPALACGVGLYGGNDARRRVIAATVSVPTTSCQ
jgi:type IV pilus assembly protein PilV